MIKLKRLSHLLVLSMFFAVGCQSGATEETASDQDSATMENSAKAGQGEDDSQGMMGQQIQPLAEVSDEELVQFQGAAMSVQAYSQKVQGRMFGMVQKAGFNPQRYSQLLQAEESNDTSIKTTPEEQKKFEELKARMQKLQAGATDTMEMKIRENGLTSEKYQAILATVRQDTSLQRKLNEMQQQQMGMGNPQQP